MNRPPRRRLPTARPWLVALVLVVVVLGALSGAAAAQTDDGAEEAAPALRLVQQTSWVGPEAVFQVSFRAEGLPEGATAGAVLHPRARTRAALDDALTGGARGGTFWTVRQRPVSELVGPDGSITVSLPVTSGIAANVDTVPLSTPGVYPYTVQVLDADGDEIAQLVTTMLRLDEPDPSATSSRLAVGVVVPVHAPVTLAFDGTPVLDDEGAADLVATIGAVADRPDVQLTVAPSPESLDLLAARGPDGEAAVDELRTIVARQLLANPYAPIDTGAWVQAGLGAEMGEQWAAGTTAAQARLATIPDPTTTVVDRTVSPAALARMKELGVRYVPSRRTSSTPLSSASTTSTFAQQFDIEAGDGGAAGTLRAVVADDTTAARLTTGDDPVLSGHSALAELALLHLLESSDARGIAVVVPTTTDPTALSTLLAGLAERDGASSGSAGDPMVSPVTLTDLFSSTEVAGATRSDPSRWCGATSRTSRPASPATRPGSGAPGASLAGLRSLVPTSPTLAAPAAATTLSSGDRTLSPEQRTAVLDSAQRAIDAVAAEIVVAPEQVVTLTSSSGRVPLNLENRLQAPVSVRIVLSSAKLDFPEGAVIEQVLPPAQTTRIDLPVETRASGAFPLSVTITSADGSLPVATTRYTVRSTAISGVGLVLSIGAGLFLLVWWGRHFRTARRARQLVASNHPALSGTEPDGYAPPNSDPMEGDEPRPHRHRQLVRPHRRRDRYPRHRGGAPEHPIRYRRVHRP